jgi:DNA-binding transcriptional regulator LsrR (DeoR family)
LLGIGTTDLNYSTYYNAGYLALEEMQGLIEVGAVGNVCGLFFDIDGNPTARDFQSRSFTISKRDLINIPVRIGMAGGPGKIKAILGALRGGYMNVIVTDDLVARKLIQMSNN